MEGKDEHGVSLVSASDNQYEVSARAATAGGSALLACVIEQDPDSTDPIYLPSVSDRDLGLIIQFLEMNAKDPITKIDRPLNSPDLPDSGVPGWADEYIRAVRWEHLLDLIEAAGAMRIQMLVFLGCARIAAAIMRVGVESLAQALGVQDVDADAAGIDSKSIKMQNEWAWKEKDCPAVAPPSST